tara:strand:- start:1209 stop:1574 length:366 start_codon:yes stop_codon:yes gene_type:complete
MKYTVAEINNNVAKIKFSDDTWTFVELNADMKEEELDDLIFQIAPIHLKSGSGTPSFLSAGQDRTAKEVTIEERDASLPDWYTKRQEAYGTLTSQIEYITEKGLEAWQAHVAKIKADNPKT